MIHAAPRIGAALGSWLMGNVTDATRLAEDARSFAAQRQIPQAQTVTAATAAIIAQLDGDPQRVAELAAEIIHSAAEARTRQWHQWGQLLGWWAGIGSVEPEPPRTMLRPYFLTLLADQLHVEPDRALDLLDEALETARFTSELFCEAEILRVRAAVHGRLHQRDEARTSLLEAVAVARAQGARMLELRALTDLVVLDDQPSIRLELKSCLESIDSTTPTRCTHRAAQVLDGPMVSP
jgi:plasmid stability protein